MQSAATDAAATASPPMASRRGPPAPPPPLVRAPPATSDLPATRRRGASMQVPASARFSRPLQGGLAGGRSAAAAAGNAGGGGAGVGASGEDASAGPAPGSRFKRRVASMPDARLNFQETSSGGGAALRALAMLRQWRASANDDDVVTVRGREVEAVLRLVERAASVITDSRSVEMVMKYKFLTLPDVYDPELQRFLLDSYTPKQGPRSSMTGAAAGPGAAPAGVVGAAVRRPGRVSPVQVKAASPALSYATAGVPPRAVSPITPASPPASPSLPAAAPTAAAAGAIAGAGMGGGAGAAGAATASDPTAAAAAAAAASDDTPTTESPRRRSALGATGQPLTHPLTDMLNKIGEWEFDVFAVNELCPGETLLAVGFRLFQQANLLAAFHVPETTLVSFLRAVEAGYLDNPYHNAMHGADVAVALHYIIDSGGMHAWMSQLQVFACIVAALVHDVAHPAVNNAFLMATEDPLALQYNDMSPLENMHIAKGFEMARPAASNIFATLPSDDFKAMRKTIIQMVLATDNEFHFEYLGKLSQALNVPATKSDAGTDTDGLVCTPKGQLLVLQIALHAADVSNSAKPWDYYLNWTDRIIAEFFAQGDKERELGMPVTPMLDRTKAVPLPKFQAGFINAIVLPLYTDLHRVHGVSVPVPLKYLSDNLAVWNARVQDMNASSRAAAAAASASATPPKPASAPSTPAT